MKKRKRKTSSFRKVLIIVLIITTIMGLFYYNNRKKLQVITIVSSIDEYGYYLESNASDIYKKYYEELSLELKKEEINEENYLSLISKLFVIDFYTLNNKITNKNIGGIQFIHSNLRDSFISSSSTTVYKYVKSNLYGNRKQKLPEVNKVEVEKINKIKYEKKEYKDNLGYEVVIKVGYVNDYDYPDEVILTIIHDDNKLAIVEIK